MDVLEIRGNTGVNSHQIIVTNKNRIVIIIIGVNNQLRGDRWGIHVLSYTCY